MIKKHYSNTALFLIMIFSLTITGYSQTSITVKVGENSKVFPLHTINSENYIQIPDFTEFAKFIDKASTVKWYETTGLIAATIQNKKCTLSSNEATVLVENMLLNTKLSVYSAREMVFIPESTLRLIVKFLDNVEIKPAVTNRSSPTAAAQQVPSPTSDISGGKSESPTSSPTSASTSSPTSSSTSDLEATQAAETSTNPPDEAGVEEQSNINTSSKAENVPGLVEMSNVGRPKNLKGIAIVLIPGKDDTAVLKNISEKCRSILDEGGMFDARIFEYYNDKTPLDKLINEINTSGIQLLIVLKTAYSNFEQISGFKIFCVNDAVDIDGRKYKSDMSTGKSLPYDANYLSYQMQNILLSRILEEEMTKNVQAQNLGIELSPLYLLKRAAMPSVVIEIGYMSNRKDRKNLEDSNYIAAQAQSICNAILRFKSK